VAAVRGVAVVLVEVRAQHEAVRPETVTHPRAHALAHPPQLSALDEDESCAHLRHRQLFSRNRAHDRLVRAATAEAARAASVHRRGGERRVRIRWLFEGQQLSGGRQLVSDAPPLARALISRLERATRIAELSPPEQQLRRRRADLAERKGDAVCALGVGASELNAQAPDASAVLGR
jgi:hypothetical protein